MSSAPLKINIVVSGEAHCVVDALVELRVDIGSVNARRVFANADANLRFLCVAMVDEAAVERLLARLVDRLAGSPALGFIARYAVSPLPLDARLVIFPDVVALESPL